MSVKDKCVWSNYIGEFFQNISGIPYLVATTITTATVTFTTAAGAGASTTSYTTECTYLIFHFQPVTIS